MNWKHTNEFRWLIQTDPLPLQSQKQQQEFELQQQKLQNDFALEQQKVAADIQLKRERAIQQGLSAFLLPHEYCNRNGKNSS